MLNKNEFNPMSMTDSFFCSFILLLISVWSAFSFYWSGYRNAEMETEHQIISQQNEIKSLKKQLLETQLTNFDKKPIYKIASLDKKL